jgi:excinuclease ABC subunit C
LYGYVQAIGKVFSALDADPLIQQNIERKDVWLLASDSTQLFVYQERGGVFKKRHAFAITAFDEKADIIESIKECFLGFYRSFTPSPLIITNIDFGDDAQLYGQFLTEQHAMQLPVHIHYPQDGHFAALVRMGMIHMQQELERKGSLAFQLQKLFELNTPVHSIDCFDISHKQGTAMVGACVRFIDGKPAPSYFRKFEIKTVQGQDDYASLREVVARRYRNRDEIPDLVLIDGGKGQLSAVTGLIAGAEFASLAKREETIFSHHFPAGKVLDQELYVSKVLIALRDYTHHFAITYHRVKERQGI